MLEEGSFRDRTADFVFMFLFGGVFMAVCACFVHLLFLGHAFTIMLVYVWSRRNPHIRMNFFGVISFNAPYLPWVLLFFSLLLGNNALVDVFGESGRVGLTVPQGSRAGTCTTSWRTCSPRCPTASGSWRRPRCSSGCSTRRRCRTWTSRSGRAASTGAPRTTTTTTGSQRRPRPRTTDGSATTSQVLYIFIHYIIIN